MTSPIIINALEGFQYLPEALSKAEQVTLIEAVLTLVVEAPFYRPATPFGKPLRVEMTNLGEIGWITDAKGYRYSPVHPVTGQPWPAIPPTLMAYWRRFCATSALADACLINRYDVDGRMGLHQDKDEASFDIPVLSISLGDTAMFRLGGVKRSGPSRAFPLRSGDVCVLAGPARLAFHGIDRILAGSSSLVPGGGRLNLTLRRARAVEAETAEP